jgi:hypothetical protein
MKRFWRQKPIAAEQTAEAANGELKSAMLGDLSRRLFGKRLLVAIPVAAAALLTDSPEVAEAGVDGDWTLTGNSLPDATKFLGSTNARPLTFKTNNATRMTIAVGGNVGIGTASPTAKLHAVTSAALAIRGQTPSSSGIGVQGTATSTTGTTIGVYGSSISGIGVYGATSATDDYFLPGVYGRANGSGGSGVFGYGPQGNGVIGRSDRDGWAAVYGVNNAGNTGFGVVGDSINGTGMLGRGYNGVRGEGRGRGVEGITISGDGVRGRADGNGFGVVGSADLTGSGYAGYFFGRVHVAGPLSVSGAKSFVMDHPLDPANAYLYHAAVEAPEMLNIYSGNVTTDANGAATVSLPAYFEALNRDFRYQLTVIGEFAQAIVASEIKNNRFTIKTDKPNVKVSWQVSGIRQDAYAQAHPMQVEVEKPQAKRGKYLFPQGFGRPESDGVEYERLKAAGADLPRAEVSAPAPVNEPAAPGARQ